MRIVIGKDQAETENCTVINNGGQLTSLWGGDICVGIRTSKGFFVVQSDGANITIEHDEKVIFSTEDEEEYDEHIRGIFDTPEKEEIYE